MHGAGGGAPEGNKDATKNGATIATSLALKKEVEALARLSGETMAEVKSGN
jgi:hypothetical protein